MLDSTASSSPPRYCPEHEIANETRSWPEETEETEETCTLYPSTPHPKETRHEQDRQRPRHRRRCNHCRSRNALDRRSKELQIIPHHQNRALREALPRRLQALRLPPHRLRRADLSGLKLQLLLPQVAVIRRLVLEEQVPRLQRLVSRPSNPPDVIILARHSLPGMAGLRLSSSRYNRRGRSATVSKLWNRIILFVGRRPNFPDARRLVQTALSDCRDWRCAKAIHSLPQPIPATPDVVATCRYDTQDLVTDASNRG